MVQATCMDWVSEEILDIHDRQSRSNKEINKSTEIFLMHGNRDFLIGPAFVSSSGMKLLTDPYAEEMFGKSVLLMHGDLLCTGDIDYQSFRKTSRDRKWQDAVLGNSWK